MTNFIEALTGHMHYRGHHYIEDEMKISRFMIPRDPNPSIIAPTVAFAF